MRRDLITSACAIVVLTVVLGIGYPLAVTAASQLLWPNKADGSQIVLDGKVVGSKLLAQPFLSGKNPDPRYFQPRPSQSSYNPAATFFSNRGPNSSTARFFYRDQLRAYLALERTYSPGLTAARVPVDAVTTSASGVDPHISPANAAIQARRVAATRKLPLSRVRTLISANTDGRLLGVLGEPGVNVTTLNLALDAA